jgi:unsaturated rhamnogalacturonyl hydrolase
MALIDVLQEMDERIQKAWCELKNIFKEAIEGLISYQDRRTGMWHQVLDKGGEEGNYLETSATLMFSYSILKGCRLGYLPASFADFGLKAFYGTLRQYLSEKDGKLMLGGICSVAGLGNTPYRDGSYEYYISEKVSCNDPKGVGALMMACSEIIRQERTAS